MNPLLQTFFIAIFGVLILTSPAEKRLPSADLTHAVAEQNDSFRGGEKGSHDSQEVAIENYTNLVCASPKVSTPDAQIPEAQSSKNLRVNPYLTKSLDKFFILVGYLTGFEKLSNFMISQRH